MADTDEREVSLEELEKCRKEHVRELKRIEKMSDAQFEAFKRNFALGKLDPAISRREAVEILRSMICTNLTLQQEKRADQAIAKSDDECYPTEDPERE